jgi:pyridoxal/pyridoxine/pyridoxamine kinase
MSSSIPSSPLSRDEWFNAVLAPTCSKDALKQIKRKERKNPFSKVDELPPNEQVQAIMRIYRELQAKNPNATRLQIPC